MMPKSAVIRKGLFDPHLWEFHEHSLLICIRSRPIACYLKRFSAKAQRNICEILKLDPDYIRTVLGQTTRDAWKYHGGRGKEPSRCRRWRRLWGALRNIMPKKPARGGDPDRPARLARERH
jgi:hypothetical protein